MKQINKKLNPEEIISREIKAAMILRGIKQTDLAKQAGVNRATINTVITGRIKSTRLRQLIARAVEKDITYYWPEEKAA